MTALVGTTGCGKSGHLGRAPRPDAGEPTTGDADPSPDGSLDSPVFPAPFTVDALNRAGIGSANSTGWATTGAATADVDWKRGPFARALLVVDLDTTCYPFDKWSTNRPPPGQNWPADCDAFDRNFNAFIDDSGGTPQTSLQTPYEIMHAVTPFGGPEHIEVDLTDLANALPGKHRLRVDLGSFSDSAGLVTGSNAGWTVSARFDLTPGIAPHHVLAAVPLYAGRIEAGDPWPVVSWTTPAGAIGGRIEYQTSGHGQGAVGPRCVGPAEEFCDRRHQIFVDGAQVEDIEPYREDCATLCTLAHAGPVDGGLDYCQENPGGLPQSVRAPRANWCPGSMTAPFSWDDIPSLGVPGPHTFSFQISQIATGGHWLASAIYYAYGP